jgi:hypothetical protein
VTRGAEKISRGRVRVSSSGYRSCALYGRRVDGKYEQLATAFWRGGRLPPAMAYSPLGGLGASLLGDPNLARIAAAHACSTAAVALA